MNHLCPTTLECESSGFVKALLTFVFVIWRAGELIGMLAQSSMFVKANLQLGGLSAEVNNNAPGSSDKANENLLSNK